MSTRLVECSKTAGLAPHMRGRLRDIYMSGDRAAADALLEKEQRKSDARERPVRAPAVAPVLPGDMRVTEPPFVVGCFHCGKQQPRHSCARPRLHLQDVGQ